MHKREFGFDYVLTHETANGDKLAFLPRGIRGFKLIRHEGGGGGLPVAARVEPEEGESGTSIEYMLEEHVFSILHGTHTALYQANLRRDKRIGMSEMDDEYMRLKAQEEVLMGLANTGRRIFEGFTRTLLPWRSSGIGAR